MLFDVENLFSDRQAVTTTGNSANAIDTGTARDLLAGEALTLVVQVSTAFTAAGAATLTVALETDDNVSFSSATTLLTSPAIPVAALTAGARPVQIRVPRGAERYLRLVYTVATGPMTAGAVIAGLVLAGTLEDSARTAYPRGAYQVA
jgi:uncharacterized membrane protein